MKKWKILTISAISAAFAVAVGFALQGHSRAQEAQRLLENSYLHAYREFTTAVTELNSSLQKSRYVTTPILLGTLCTDIYGKSVAAQMALGELPDSSIYLEQTSAFLARAGEYARALAKQAAEDGRCSDEGRDTLAGLADASSVLACSLLDLQSDLAWGSVPISTLLQAEAALAEQAGDGQAAAGGTSFQSMEADFPEVPTLIYDGPFSEHLGGKTPLALDGLPQVGRDEARAVAAEFLSLKPDLFTLASQGEGVLPAWGFSAVVDGGEVYVEVTRQGGKVLSVISSRPVGEATVTAEQAVETARAFLQDQGFGKMTESYYINQGNVLTINFATLEGETICYPDLIKVSVALDNGAVIGFESHGWIMNHTDRVLDPPAVDQQAARAVVAPELEVLSHQMALIPTGGQYELLCHEFKCTAENGGHVIVYVNAATGNEEKILLLVEDETGTLVL